MSEFLKTYLFLPVPGDLSGLRFDLQLFAAEDEGRTEEPTEKKIREAREKGQVAKSQELPQSVVVIFGMLVLLMFGSWILGNIAGVVKYYLSSFSTQTITERSLRMDFVLILSASAKVLLPIFLATVVAAVIGDVAQVGFQVSTHPLKPDWNRLKFDPATIMKKIFFSKQVAMNLFKSVFKVTAIGIVAYMIIRNNFDQILQSPDISIAHALSNFLIIALKIIIWTSLLLLLLSVPDYIFQKREFLESLKMTKQEIKEELKETIGDPYMRARLREMQRELIMKNMITEVPRADVVITNPTHFAVAMKYDLKTMEAPTVIAKGIDSLALKIRQLARENDITMIENRPLAQELYYNVDAGDIIPEELFYAVSLVYAELYRKKEFRAAI